MFTVSLILVLAVALLGLVINELLKPARVYLRIKK